MSTLVAAATLAEKYIPDFNDRPDVLVSENEGKRAPFDHFGTRPRSVRILR